MNSNRYLIAMTPRAGRWNACLIVPPDMGIDQKSVAAIAESAQLNPIGDGYFAVSRDVVQESTGRTAPESLILVGPGVNRLNPHQSERLKKSMEAQLVRLEKLVTEEITWGDEGQPGLLERDELNVWLEELEEDRGFGERIHRVIPRGISILIAIMLVFMLAFWISNEPGQKKDNLEEKFLREVFREDHKGNEPAVLKPSSFPLGLIERLLSKNETVNEENPLSMLVKKLEGSLFIKGDEVELLTPEEAKVRLREIVLQLHAESLIDEKTVVPHKLSETREGYDRLLSLADFQGKLRGMIERKNPELEPKDCFWEYFLMKKKNGFQGTFAGDVEAFRKLMDEIPKVLKAMEDLHVDANKYTLLTSKTSFRWKFYVPSDVYASKQLLDVFNNCYQSAYEDGVPENQEPLRVVVSFEKNVKTTRDDAKKRKDGKEKKACDDLLEFINQINKFLNTQTRE